MSVKIQVVLSQDQRDQLRRQAALEGLSLSTWLKRAGLQCLERAQTAPKLDSAEALAVFFDQCDAREQGREPDWDEYLAVISRSRVTGLAAP